MMQAVPCANDTRPVAEFDSWPGPAGYRLPAEWEPQAANWLSWPHNRRTWPGALAAVESAMAAIVAALAESGKVHVNVLDEAQRLHVRKRLGTGVPHGQIEFHLVPTDDAWCRDYGAIFVVNDPRDRQYRRSAPALVATGRQSATRRETRSRNEKRRRGLLALDFGFNAWGERYRPYDRDAAVAAAMAAALGVPRWVPDIVLEGGAVDANGAGALLAAESCLLSPNRNPGLDRAVVEMRLKHALGASQVIWLEGRIEGDDTDGHVDTVARFVAADRVVVAAEGDSGDANHRPLRAIRARLADTVVDDGKRLEIVDLPMPEPLYWRARRLPASYLNFHIANRAVLVPQFGSTRDGLARDARARDILRECFPGRRIAPIDCRYIVIGRGAVHCLTQPVPALRYTPATAAADAAADE